MVTLVSAARRITSYGDGALAIGTGAARMPILEGGENNGRFESGFGRGE